VNRLTLSYFVLNALNVLGQLDGELIDKKKTIDWIYSLQVTGKSGGDFQFSSSLVRLFPTRLLRVTMSRTLDFEDRLSLALRSILSAKRAVPCLSTIKVCIRCV
jgi:hypothetical protein